MKKLIDIVKEDFTLKKKGKIAKMREYNYHPKDIDELRSLLEQLLKERGKDADLNDIDVSNITTFYDKRNNRGLFMGLDPHNIKLDQWDVSKVKDMKHMFGYCTNFNCDLSDWDVNQVENMQSMFYSCAKFNSDLSKWDVSNVEDMFGMFYGCENFNCDLSKWNVCQVEDMREMFTYCTKFNSDLSSWDVSKVEDMSGMFYRCKSLKNKPEWYIK